ncbi:MAG: glycosyltransferase [Bacteroidales bacterium]|nr:glycosyltransferase [Bacteroidales bacterium]
MWLEHLIYSSQTWILVVSGLMLSSLLIQLYCYIFIYKSLPFAKSPVIREKKMGVSVIICSRNEAENLARNLPAFLNQQYPEFEIVVVNDCSTDHTEDVLMDLKVNHPRLRYTSIPLDNKFSHGKKLAVTVGIKAASYDHLLFSNPDCYPVSDQWIRMMSRNFRSGTEIVLGAGKYERRKGLLNTMARYDVFFRNVQYLSAALRGKPFMGAGRNLAYTKNVFYKNKGFAGQLKTLYGDDDLFVNQAANASNTAVEFSHDSLTLSVPPSGFKEWLRQKKQQMSTFKYYKTSARIRLTTEFSSRLLFYFSFIFLLFFKDWQLIAAGAWLLYSTVRTIVVKLNMNRLNEWDLLLSSFILDLLIPVIITGIRMSSVFIPRRPKWN